VFIGSEAQRIVCVNLRHLRIKKWSGASPLITGETPVPTHSTFTASRHSARSEVESQNPYPRSLGDEVGSRLFTHAKSPRHKEFLAYIGVIHDTDIA